MGTLAASMNGCGGRGVHQGAGLDFVLRLRSAGHRGNAWCLLHPYPVCGVLGADFIPAREQCGKRFGS